MTAKGMISYILIIALFSRAIFGRYDGYLDPTESYDRAEIVRIYRAQQWTVGLPAGAKCVQDGKRCAIGLACKYDKAQGGSYCATAVVMKELKDVEDIALLKEGAVCVHSCLPGLKCVRDDATDKKFCEKRIIFDFKYADANFQDSDRFLRWLFSRRKPSPSRSPSPAPYIIPASPTPQAKKSSLLGKLFGGLFKATSTLVSTVTLGLLPDIYEESVAEQSYLNPEEYVGRSSKVFVQTSYWTTGISLGESCTNDGPRCSIPLICNGQYCVKSQEVANPTSKAESDEMMWRKHIAENKGTKLGDKCTNVGSICYRNLICRGNGNTGFCMESR